MQKGGVAKRYARAVFELALDDNELDKWHKDLKNIAGAFVEPDLATVFLNSRVPLDTRRQLMAERLPELGELPLNLVSLLLMKSRTGSIEDILDEYGRLVNEHLGIEIANVTTAIPLAENDKEALGKRLEEVTGKRIILETSVDQEIIGGMIARIGDKVIDGSTRTRLVALKRSLAGAAR